MNKLNFENIYNNLPKNRVNVDIFDEIDSTNDEAKRISLENEFHLVIAEKQSKGRWLVLIIGFLSILLVFSPENQSIQLVALIALLGTCCGALSTIVQKYLSKSFSEIQLMVWYSLGVSFLSLPFCLYFWGDFFGKIL